MMSQHRLPRWTILLLMFVVCAMVMANWPGFPAQASPPPTTQADKILQGIQGARTAGGSEGQPIYQAQETAVSEAPPEAVPYEMEGPDAPPVRSTTEQHAHFSLADQRNSKGTSRLIVSANTGEPGSTLEISGHGYEPGQRVRLFWDGEDVTGRQLILTDFLGNFAWGFDIPSPMTNGAHTLTALEASLDEAVLAADDTHLQASSATITVTGGLPAGSAISSLEPPVVEPHSVVDGEPSVQQGITKTWTFAVYIAGDNDLSTFADVNLNWMSEAGGTNASVNVVALSDRSNRPTQYLEVNSSGSTDVTPSDVSGNLDTGDPQKFVDFMRFVAENYPAEQYAVVVWNHGGGWKAVESDDRSGNYWTMTELREALQGGLNNLGKEQYDLLLFDTCLMSQYEVAYQVEDLVDVLVASAEVVPGPGTPYNLYLSRLLQNPALTPEQFAIAIVEQYEVYYRSQRQSEDEPIEYTMSALKLEEPFTAFKDAVNQLANALLAIGATAAGSFQEAHDDTLKYKDRDFVDIGAFAAAVKREVSDSAVQQAADNLIAALQPGPNNLVLREVHGEKSAGSLGLSIYLPSSINRGSSARGSSARPGFSPGYGELLVRNTGWFTFTRAFFTGEYPNALPPNEEPPDIGDPPPPAAASLSDIVYTSRQSSQAFDLSRIQSVASPDQVAQSLPLLSDGFRNSYPRWSPDGRRVVYTSDRGGSDTTGLSMNLFMISSTGIVNETSALAGGQSQPVQQPQTQTPVALSNSGQQPMPEGNTCTALPQPATREDLAQATTSAAPQQGGGTELVVNGGFEDTAAWRATNFFYDNQPDFTNNGVQYALSGNNEEIASGVMFQTVTIPTGANSGRLTFYLRIIDPTGGTGSRDDTIFGALTDAAGTQIYAQSETFFGTVPDTDWVMVTVDVASDVLTPLRGQSVNIYFQSSFDQLTPHTAFLIDDVSFQTFTTTRQPTPTSTATQTATATPTGQAATSTPTDQPVTPTATTGPDLPDDRLIQLTNSTVDCENGYGTGAPCTIEQSFDPAWLSDSSGLLYTKIFFDLTSTDPAQWVIRESIHLITLNRSQSDPGYDVQLLPNPDFTWNDVPLEDDVLFENADFNGDFLMFRYEVTAAGQERYDQTFLRNNIGVLDFTESDADNPPVLRIFILNDPTNPASAQNYLLTQYPAWWGSRDNMAFLYTRVGNPPALNPDGNPLDPRPAPPASTVENSFETYDIGHLTFSKNADGTYSFFMLRPIFAFPNASQGEGVFYRPSWKPDDSGSLTASYSSNGGYTYDIALYYNGTDQDYSTHRGFRITTDGYSYLPSWGKVEIADVPARMEVNVDFLEPGPGAGFQIAGSGFVPNEQVQLLRGYSQDTISANIETATADQNGSFTVDLGLSKGMPVGVLWFRSRGSSSGKTSNIDNLVVLGNRDDTGETPTVGPDGGTVTTPDDTNIVVGSGVVGGEVRVLYQRIQTPTNPFQGDTLRAFTLELLDESNNPVQPGSPIQIIITYTDEELRLSSIDEADLVLYHWDEETSSWVAVENVQVDTVSNRVTAQLSELSQFVLSDSRANSGNSVYLPFVRTSE